MNWIVTQNFREWVGDQVIVGPFDDKGAAESAATHMNKAHPLVDGEWVTRMVHFHALEDVE
jgi:hypothetical protein